MPDIHTQYQQMIRPSAELIEELRNLDGDILLLGAGGKMGPSLAKLAKQACKAAGTKKRVIAVSRFSDGGLENTLNLDGIETIAADLLDDNQLQTLPSIKNVLYLAGTKFGTTGRESFTWAMNTYLPGRVAEKFRDSRIVVFSTGNVYPLTAVKSGGATETTQPQPLGEYAQSCLGRERMFQYFSALYQTPLFIYRLNYANDVAYGVLMDIAKAVFEQRPVDLRMGYVNVIWQGDANELALRALAHCAVPARIVNVTGSQTTAVRWLASQFAQAMGKQPIFQNTEMETALLSNAHASVQLFGEPRTSLAQMIQIISAWVMEGGATINKPTHFQEREGQF